MRILGIAVLFVLVLIALGLLFFVPAQAQDPVQEQAREIAKSLNCPICVGYTLYECPLEVCEDWRALIRQKLSTGETREEIVQYFIDQYGEQVLNYPRPQGFNWLAWVLPFLALGGGGIWVALLLRRLVRQRQAMVPAVPEDTADEYRQRVEEELKEWD